ncbi:MAG TPA: hypothetical protein VLB51_02250 [Methylomirabilota bacterium]|nr:hypothetical protein [Methylomirabilota bacterium]
MSAPHDGNVGTVTSVHGGVVDAAFGERLPAKNALLRTGDDDRVALGVATQVDATEAFGIDGAASVVLAALEARACPPPTEGPTSRDQTKARIDSSSCDGGRLFST